MPDFNQPHNDQPDLGEGLGEFQSWSLKGWDEERLIEFVLAEAPSESDRCEVEADPILTERARDLGAFLGQVRSAFTLPEEIGLRPHRTTRRVTDQVLDQTTREDLSLRGDLRVFRAFVGTRLRQSGLLRLAAASLLVHVIGVPVVMAYVLFTEPERPTELTIHVAEPVQEFPDLDPEPFDFVRTFDPSHPQYTAPDELSWDRQLIRNGLPEADGQATAPATERLAARARDARGLSHTALLPSSDPLSQIVHAEWMLDRFTRGWSTAGEVERALARLPAGTDDPIGLLSMAAIARAESYQLLDSTARARLDRARESFTRGADLLEGRRSGGPAGPVWRAHLTEALEALGVDDPIARAWR
jgi:hypothetical protein